MNESGLARQTAPGVLASPGSASFPMSPGAERVLADMAERWLRYPADKVVLVLHLSRLAAPAPRSHHLRVARVLMQDCAQRTAGQVLLLQNQDLVLLCAAQRDAHNEAADASAQLKATLARLFVADVPDPGRLLSYWRLDEDPAPFRTYVAGVPGVVAPGREKDREKGGAPGENMPASALSLAALEEIAAQAPLGELMVQQTGMRLDPDRKKPLAERLKPAFRQLGVSLAPLNLRPVVTEALTDPYLLHHFSARLDARMLRLLHDDLRAEGRLTRPALNGGMPIHVCLSLEAILSPGFARMSRLARGAGVRMGIEVPVMQACIEMDLLDHVRSLLDLAGFELILGPLEPAMLKLVQTAPMRPDAVKLVWSQHLADAPADAQTALAAALARIGMGRVVLQGVESDQGVAWGQARGISRFQGGFFDHAQAAARMAGCPAASACTLRQCVSRAGSQGIAGRAGCTNPALLDSASITGGEGGRH
jgi:EAL domain-containing protein (putative c-di-GMP-specific phosphodiesterase class I)